MVQRISIRLTDILMQNQVGDSDKYDWYVYGFELLLGKILSYSLLLLVALLLGEPIQLVVFSVFFLTLRKRSGGYHASKNWVCALSSAVLFALCVGLVQRVTFSIWLALAIVVVAGAVVFALAPINHPNLHLDSDEVAQLRKSSRLVFGAEAALIAIIWALGLYPYAFMAALAVGLVAATMLLAKLTGQEMQPLPVQNGATDAPPVDTLP